MIKRLLLLVAIASLLVLPSPPRTNADAGGACLGQWSECRSTCTSRWHQIDTGIEAMCWGDCDYQLDKCLRAPRTSPDPN